MGKIKVRNRDRLKELEIQLAAERDLRVRATNELNRRIDNLCELIIEIDKKMDTKLDTVSNRDNSDICDNVLIDYDNDCAP